MRFRAAAKGRRLFLLAAVCLLSALLLSPAAEASRSLPAAIAPALSAPATPDQVLETELTEPPERLRIFDDLSLPPRPLELVEASKTATGVKPLGLGLNTRQTGDLSRESGGLSFQGLWTDPVTGIAYARNRWYDARTASWLSEDPMGAVDSPNLYAFVGWGPHVGRDPMGLAVYFFDGTANNPGQENPTNVFRLFENTREAAFYSTGIGGDQPTGVKIFNDLLTAYFKFSGTGFEKKAEMMYLRVVEQYNRGDTDISIVGFSRGAATARHLANLISERGIPDLSSVKIEKSGGTTRIVVGKYLNKKPAIKFLGLFDTVASIGWPGDESNPGMRLGIPNSVMRVRHATAASEKRRGFPLNSV